MIAIIPARGGSVRIPRKNIRPFRGKPVIAYSIEAARKAGIDRVIVSSDDDEIGAVAAKFGAEYCKRSKAISGPNVRMLDVILEVLEKQKEMPEIICMLYAVAPMVRSANIEAAELYIKSGAFDIATTIYRSPGSFERTLTLSNDMLTPVFPEFNESQSNTWDATYQVAGQFFVARVKTLFEQGTFMVPRLGGILIPYLESSDVDTEDDWQEMERRAELFAW